MKPSVLILCFLLIFSLFALADTPVEKDTKPTISDTLVVKTDSLKAEQPEEISDKVIVYYFHGTRRCSNCIKFEDYSKEAIDSGFAAELANGTLEWRPFNTDESENKHYVNDYQLYTKSVVLSKVVDGKEAEWKNLDKIWKLVASKEKFIEYVQEEIKAYQKED